jgi:hypothetical protein
MGAVSIVASVVGALLFRPKKVEA